MGSGCVIEGLSKACLELVEFNIGRIQARVNVCQLACDPVLLSLEEIERHSVGIVCLRGTRLVVQSLCGLGLMGRGPL